MKSIKQILKSHGFVADSFERTAGAEKTWYKPWTKTKEKVDEVVARILLDLGYIVTHSKTDYNDQWLGEGFEFERQDHNTLFLAKYRKGKAGLEYEMGIDN